jgi:hypothetical protein
MKVGIAKRQPERLQFSAQELLSPWAFFQASKPPVRFAMFSKPPRRRRLVAIELR